MQLNRPEHIESDLLYEEVVCRACGARQAWQSRVSETVPLGEIVVRAAQFVQQHEGCGRLVKFLKRRQPTPAAEKPAAPTDSELLAAVTLQPQPGAQP